MSWLKSFWGSLFTPDHGQPLSNFSPRAQQVLALARKEADRLNHNFVGTEHLLLGIIKLGQGTAVGVLANMGLSLDDVQHEVEQWIGVGSERKPLGATPYTPRFKKVLALAGKEAKALNHTYVGTEHILLGLLGEGDGVAPRVLKKLGVEIETTRQNILNELDPNYSPPAEKKAMSQNAKHPEREPIDIARRYDIHFREGEHEVVYRNARFKGIKTLFKEREYDVFAEYVELEQENGQTLFINRALITKFCEHRG
jgi:ATP-dependent Clp protease ATP-binding subunit ClpA